MRRRNAIPAAGAPNRAAEEKAACIKNLKVIYDAIQAFQADHRDLPNWLSDLVPQYLADANVLVCPVCRRTGQTEAPPLADPKLPSSYLFEFCPVPLGRARRTRRPGPAGSGSAARWGWWVPWCRWCGAAITTRC